MHADDLVKRHLGDLITISDSDMEHLLSTQRKKKHALQALKAQPSTAYVEKSDTGSLHTNLSSRLNTDHSLNPWIRESPLYYVLSTRTRRLLEAARIHSIEDLRMNRTEDLLSLHGFGSKCLREVEAFLKAHQAKLREGRTAPAQLSDDLHGVSTPESFEDFLSLVAKFPFVHRRLQEYANVRVDLTLDIIAQCQRKVEWQTAEGILDDRVSIEWAPLQELARKASPPASTISDTLFWAQYLVCSGFAEVQHKLDAFDKALDTHTLDAEIDQILSCLNERVVRVIKNRLSVEVKKTLSVLGEELGVSRERVRQLEDEGIKKLRQSYFDLPLPRLRTAMVRVRICTTFSREEIREKLFEDGLVQENSTVDDFLTVWKAIRHYAQPFPEEILAYAKAELTYVQREVSSEVRRSFLRQLRVLGVVELEEIVSDLEEQKCSVQDIVSVLAKSGLSELAPGYWGTVDKKYTLHRAAEKMITACGPLHIGHLHVGLIRHQQRLDRSAPPPELVRTALDIHEAFSVDAEDVARLQELGPGAMPTDAEHVWLRTFGSYGPVVHASTIYYALAEEKLNPGLAYQLMNLSELVQPIGEGLYCLPGVQFSETELEAGRTQASKRWIRRYDKEQ